MSWGPIDQDLVAAVDRLLQERYGGDRSALLLGQVDSNPVDVLVATVLSQATTDRASLAAFRRLKERFPRWEMLLGASTAQLEKLIAPAGLGRQKALRILDILKALQVRGGGVSLDFLRGMPAEEARRFLEGLPGVGPKTAACVLLFGLGRAAFPVDTHVYRVARRLGLVPEKVDRVRTQKILQESLDPERYFRLHVNLIVHGRQVCRARRPRCSECPLAALCTAASTPPNPQHAQTPLRFPPGRERCRE
ncbi:MAG: endonuclease III [Bacillota bacterium]|nr:endonuclease III [Bacillota bacterium]